MFSWCFRTTDLVLNLVQKLLKYIDYSNTNTFWGYFPFGKHAQLLLNNFLPKRTSFRSHHSTKLCRLELLIVIIHEGIHCKTPYSYLYKICNKNMLYMQIELKICRSYWVLWYLLENNYWWKEKLQKKRQARWHDPNTLSSHDSTMKYAACILVSVSPHTEVSEDL
jgi:hypothetical protein